MFEELAINLENQVATHSTLYDIINLECMFDHQTDLGELNQVEADKLACMQHAHNLELERLGLSENITYELGIEPDTKLEELATYAEETIAVRLKEAREKLLLLAPEIQKQARIAAEKMQLRANCYKEVNDGFHKAFKRASLYSKSGKIKSPEGSLIVNRSV